MVNQRASEYGRALALPVSALPDGTEVKSKLIAALSSSLKADRDYLTWGQQQLDGGCTPSGQSSAYNAAFSASQLADTAKASVRAGVESGRRPIRYRAEFTPRYLAAGPG